MITFAILRQIPRRLPQLKQRKEDFRRRLPTLGVFLMGIVIMGCTTSLPPVKPVHHFKSIAGKWAGSSWNPARQHSHPVEATIAEDGSCEIVLYARSVNKDKGIIRLSRGQLHFESPKSNVPVIYHEGEGRRVLVFKGYGRDASILELEPTK